MSRARARHEGACTLRQPAPENAPAHNDTSGTSFLQAPTHANAPLQQLTEKTATKAQRLRPDSSSWHRDRTSLKTTRTSVNACTPRTPAAVVRCSLQADGRRRGGEGGWVGGNHSIEVVGCWCVQASVTPTRTKTRHINTTHFTPRRSPLPRYSSFNASIVLPVSDPA